MNDGFDLEEKSKQEKALPLARKSVSTSRNERFR